MLVKLYENVINEDGSRSPGRIVGEIRCKGDGTPGEVIFFESSNEFLEIKDVNHSSYGKEVEIMSEHRKKHLALILSRPLFLRTGGGLSSDGVHSIEGVTLDTWTREGIKDIIEYKLPAYIGTICGKIIEG